MKIFIKIISLLFFVSIMLALPIIRADKKVELKTIKENITPYINKDTFKEQSLTTLYKNYNIKKEQIEDFISYGHYLLHKRRRNNYHQTTQQRNTNNHPK